MGLVEETSPSCEDENEGGNEAAHANFDIDRENDPLKSNPILKNN